MNDIVKIELLIKIDLQKDNLLEFLADSYCLIMKHDIPVLEIRCTQKTKQEIWKRTLGKTDCISDNKLMSAKYINDESLEYCFVKFIGQKS